MTTAQKHKNEKSSTLSSVVKISSPVLAELFCVRQVKFQPILCKPYESVSLTNHLVDKKVGIVFPLRVYFGFPPIFLILTGSSLFHVLLF